MARKTVRQRALSGETVLGAMIFEFFVPGMPQMLRNAGAEYAIYDMEHGGLGLETLKMITAASPDRRGADGARAGGEYHFIARAPRCRAQGVMIPMVESASRRAASPIRRDIRARGAAEQPSALPMTTTSPAILSRR